MLSTGQLEDNLKPNVNGLAKPMCVLVFYVVLLGKGMKPSQM